MSKITHNQKETALEAIRAEGTMKAGARAAGVDVKTLNNEMNRSLIFKKRLLEAREEGHRNIADKAIELIKSYADGDMDMICIECQGTGVQTFGSDNIQCPICKGKGHAVQKTDRNRLTAAIALANAYEPGFRGMTQIQGRIEHNVRIITAVPRPKYIEVEAPKVKILDVVKPAKKLK